VLCVELGDNAVGYVLDEPGDEFFGHVHDVVDVCIGPIEFTSCEFQVVTRVDAFVAELTAYFVEAV
jgi:hypothetical protein